MKITKNWLYIINNLPFSKGLPEEWGGGINSIIIEDNLNVIIFDELNLIQNIEIWKNSMIDVFWYINNSANYNLDVSIIWENSSLKLWYLLIAWDKETIEAKISSKIKASNSSVKIKIISIVWNNWKIDLDWTLDISNNIKDIQWDLIEENLFIWDSWKINSIPNLFVWSNELRASHSCKIERINDEKLFYLRSRWIQKEKSLSMILESYTNILFKCLTMVDNDYYISLITKINNKIKTIN